MHYNVVKVVLQIANSHQDIELTFAHINKKNQRRCLKVKCFQHHCVAIESLQLPRIFHGLVKTPKLQLTSDSFIKLRGPFINDGHNILGFLTTSSFIWFSKGYPHQTPPPPHPSRICHCQDGQRKLTSPLKIRCIFCIQVIHSNVFS